jgi:hypothetical protein
MSPVEHGRVPLNLSNILVVPLSPLTLVESIFFALRLNQPPLGVPSRRPQMVDTLGPLSSPPLPLPDIISMLSIAPPLLIVSLSLKEMISLICTPLSPSMVASHGLTLSLQRRPSCPPMP